jgi:TolB-like protein
MEVRREVVPGSSWLLAPGFLCISFILIILYFTKTNRTVMQIWSTEIKELEKLHETLKGQFPELESELNQLIRTEDANVVMLYSRRCLEVIITDLCECELKRPRKTEPLKGIIDKLHREEKVPSHIITSMDSLNSLSTYGTHPKDFDPEQVKPVLSNLAIIIKWYVKYKDTRKAKEGKPEEEKFEKEVTQSHKNETLRLKRKSILVLSGIMLTIAVVVGTLFIFNFIGGKDKAKADEELAKSIAVLPFKNYSVDPGQEYMSDGLTDEIISHLFKVASFDKVVSLSTVLTYKGTDKRLPQIAEELNVNYVLEGSYKKIGDSVRIIAQLIEPKNDRHLWLYEYNRPYKEIIAIQSDIAFQIADHVKAFLTVSEKENIQKVPTTNQEAYEFVQQAVMHMYTSDSALNTDEYLKTGKDLAFKAIELDPDYSDAYALAGAYSLYAGAYSGNKEMPVAILDALPYIEKALELDPNNGRAHFLLGEINDWGRWDYIKAEKEFLKSAELEPNNQVRFDQIADFYLKMNSPENALSALANYDESDIGSSLSILAETYIISGNNKKAFDTVNTFARSCPEHLYRWIGEAFIWMEEYDSASLYLESALKSGDPQMLIPRFQAYQALVYYKTNKHQQAQAIIDKLVDKTKATSVGSPEYFIGWYYSGIGQVDSAFYWLEKAYDKHSPEMPWLKVTPVFKSLKNDARYWDLYARTGHTAHDEYMKEMKK